MRPITRLKKIRIHREGTRILIISFIILLIVNIALYRSIGCKWFFYIPVIISSALYLVMVNFFRCPIRLFGENTEKIVV
ncbi:Phosphatidylserine decarboxylase proenzyme, partial [termite gut metagenome]